MSSLMHTNLRGLAKMPSSRSCAPCGLAFTMRKATSCSVLTISKLQFTTHAHTHAAIRPKLM